MTLKETAKKGVKVRRVGLMAAMVLALTLVVSAMAISGTFEGSGGPDTIIGTPERDEIHLYSGDDTSEGRGRADQLFGAKGEDTLYGNEGSDFIHAGPHNDVVVGGDGEDELYSGIGDDTVYAGDDKVADEVQCGLGEDTAYVSGKDHQSGSLQGCENVVSFSGTP